MPMRAIVAAMTAVAAAATAMGAPANPPTSWPMGPPGFRQLLQETKTGAGARLGPHLTLLQKAYGSQPLWHDGGLRAKLPPLRMQDGYVRISAYGDDVSALRT